MRPTDLVVVGAGPAGVAAAVTARRAGLAVTVVDKATFPRDKCCGDGLTTLALRELEALAVDPSQFTSWNPVDKITLRSPGGHQTHLRLPGGPGLYSAVVRRRELDHGLVRHAIDVGVDVRQGVAFSALRHHPREGVVRLELVGAEPIAARHVIAADGMWSPVRRALGEQIEGYRGDWHAMRQYRTADGPESRRLWVWFDEDLLPGYAWSFPLPDGMVNFGFGIVRGETMSGKQMKSIWTSLLGRDHIRHVLGKGQEEGTHKAWPIPARLPGMSLWSGRVLFVGDAAAVTDPLTGEGIGQALETGRLAAEAVALGGPGSAVGRHYDRTARRSLQADHHLGQGLGRLLRRPRIAEAALRTVDVNDWTRRNFARWMFEDYPRAALLTPRRWKRGLLHRPGAFPAARSGPGD